MDPYAKSVARMIRWADEMFAYRVGDPETRERRRIPARAQGQAETETAATPKLEPVAVTAES